MVHQKRKVVASSYVWQIFFMCLLINTSCKTVKNPYPQFNQLSRPEQNFEIFWNTFKDNYALFEAKKVDWNSSYKTFRPNVNAQTTEEALVETFKKMVEPLKDGHINLIKKDYFLFTGQNDKHYFKDEFKGIETVFWQNTYQALTNYGFNTLKGFGPVLKDKAVFYASRSQDIGYIQLTRFFGNMSGVTGSTKQEIEDQKLILDLMNGILQDFKDCKALILDLRSNGGGHSGYEMAGYFVAEKLLVNYKSTKTKDGFSKMTPFYAQPLNSLSFTKPIVVLTSDRTASAAEDFCLALSRRKNTTLIGMATKGMFSDMFSAHLPNGIDFTLSNQAYYSHESILLEEKGVIPNVEMKNSKSDIAEKKDPLLTKAVEILNL